MKKILIVGLSFIVILLLVFAFHNIFSQKNKSNIIYVLELIYENGNIYFSNIYVKEGYPRTSEEYEYGYRYILFSDYNKILYSSTFLIPDKWHYDYIDEDTGEIKGGVLEIDREEFALTIPYFENGDRINIYDNNSRLILSIDISKFSNKGEINTTIYLLFIAVFISIIALIIMRKMKENVYYQDSI